MRTRPAQGVVFLAGTRLMTIYLWHLPMIVLVAGLALLIPGCEPSAGQRRVVVVAADRVRDHARRAVRAVVPGRHASSSRASPDRRRLSPIVALATVLTVAVPMIMIPLGLDFVLAIAGAITFGVAILILGGLGPSAREPPRVENDSEHPP